MKAATLTGLILFVMILGLAAFNVRKKFPGKRLGSNALWLRIHIWVGLLCVFVMLLHVDFSVPSGVFESILAVVFAATVGTGIFGLFLCRTVPHRLTDRGEDYRYDDIPVAVRTLRDKAEQLVRSSAQVEGAALADVYLAEVRPYMSGPRHFLYHWVESYSPWRQLEQRIEEHGRYMNKVERAQLGELIEVCREKFDLDYRYAQQSLLRWWLFLHVPLTYLLILMGIIHAIVAMGYGGH